MVEITRFVEHKTAGWKGLMFVNDESPEKEYIINQAGIWESTPKRLESLQEISVKQVDIPTLLEEWAAARNRMQISMFITKELQDALEKTVLCVGDKEV